MRVVKRNRSYEKFSIGKLDKVIVASVKGLDKVDAKVLRDSITEQITDGISTKDMQSMLVRTAVEQVEVDAPAWSKVAARLFHYDWEHETYLYHKLEHLADRMLHNMGEGFYDHRLFTGVQVEDINTIFQEESKQDNFEFSGIKAMRERFAIVDDGLPVETAQMIFMRVAMGLAINEKVDRLKHIRDFYKLLTNFEVMTATPTLAHGGLPNPQLSSCYVIDIFPSLEGITKTLHDTAILTKFGGGLGSSYSKIGSIGSDVGKLKGVGQGKVPYLVSMNAHINSWQQLGCVHEDSYVNIIDTINGEKIDRAHGLRNLDRNKALDAVFDKYHTALSEYPITLPFVAPATMMHEQGLVGNRLEHNVEVYELEEMMILFKGELSPLPLDNFKEYGETGVWIHPTGITRNSGRYELREPYILDGEEVVDINLLPINLKDVLDKTFGNNKMDTKISDYDYTIAYNSVKIGDVVQGDYIESYGNESCANEWCMVADTYVLEVKKGDKITIVCGDTCITTSNWHPYPIYDSTTGNIKYVRSDEVKVGDRTVKSNGDIGTVNHINPEPSVSDSYRDLSVTHNENYFCSTGTDVEAKLLIHNTRRGAIATDIENWDIDINAFLELRKNSGKLCPAI